MWLLHHGKVRLRCSCSMRNWRCDCPCSPPLPPLVNTLKSSCLSLFTQPHHTHTRLRCSLCIGHPSGHACLTAATAQSSNHVRCQYPRSRAVLMYAQCCSRLCVARAAHCCESSPVSSSSSSSHTHHSHTHTPLTYSTQHTSTHSTAHAAWAQTQTHTRHTQHSIHSTANTTRAHTQHTACIARAHTHTYTAHTHSTQHTAAAAAAHDTNTQHCRLNCFCQPKLSRSSG